MSEAPGTEPVSLLFGSRLICVRSPTLLTGLATGSPFSKEKTMLTPERRQSNKKDDVYYAGIVNKVVSARKGQ